MAATAPAHQLPKGFESPGEHPTTLLDLVGAVYEVTEDEDEVVATVLYMLRTGRARLCGNFKGVSFRDFVARCA